MIIDEKFIEKSWLSKEVKAYLVANNLLNKSHLEVAQALISDRKEAVALQINRIVSDKTEDPEELREFAKFSDWLIRRNVAENHNTPVDVLDILSKDVEETVREYVARNKMASVATLEAMTGDVEEEVLVSLIFNPSISYDALFKLSKSENKRIVRLSNRQLKEKAAKDLPL
jgi:hypothetical protein